MDVRGWSALLDPSLNNGEHHSHFTPNLTFVMTQLSTFVQYYVAQTHFGVFQTLCRPPQLTSRTDSDG